MNALFQLLSEQDIPALLELMREFYSSQRLHFDERVAANGIKRKLGKAVIAFAVTVCKQMGIKALRLEVGRENEAAQGLYRACGFAQEPRHLFTKWL